MKTFFTLLLLSLLAIPSFAQDLSLIRDVHQYGTVNDCVTALKKKGCALVKSDKHSSSSYLIVEHGVWKNCAIYLFGTKENRLSRMEMLFPECDSWNSLYAIYVDIVNDMTAEFGQPTSRRDEFIGDQQPESDYEKLNEVVNGQCSYTTIFQLKKGGYRVSISKDKAVTLQYFKY